MGCCGMLLQKKSSSFRIYHQKAMTKQQQIFMTLFFLPYQSKYHYEMAFSLQNMLNNKQNRKMKMHKRKKMTSFIIIP